MEMYKVNGEVVSEVMLYAEHKYLFEEIKNNKIKYINLGIETDTFEAIYGYDVEIKINENFDDCMDEWHGYVKIKCLIELEIETTSDKQAIELANMYYSDDSFHEKIQLFLNDNNETMIELEVDGIFVEYNKAKSLHMNIEN